MLNFNNFKLYSINEARTQEDVLKYNIGKKSLDNKEIDEAVISAIFEADPTTSKSYVNWLVMLYTRMTRNVFLEDLYKATTYLTVYDKVKYKFEEIEDRNIFNYKDLPSLFKVIEPYVEDQNRILSKRQLRGDTPVEGEFIDVYNDANWDVVIPTTHKSACYWGSGTQWCTAIDTTQSYFNSYSKDGPLYIFRHKLDPNIRYQLHIHSRQFMDRYDKASNVRKFFTNHPELRNAIIEHWRMHPDVLYMESKNTMKNVIQDKEWSALIPMYVESGVDLNVEDIDGNSSMILAAMYLNIDMLRYLIEHGGDVSNPNKFGVTPISAAVFSNHHYKSENVDDLTLEICELLHEYGADASGGIPPTSASKLISHNSKITTLIVALMVKKYKTALWLSNKDGYDINGLDQYNASKGGKNAILYTPAIKISARTEYAVGMSKDDFNTLISNLASRGIDMNATSKLSGLNRTALHQAAYLSSTLTNRAFVIDTLIKNGANPWISANGAKPVLPIELPESQYDRTVEVIEVFTKHMRKLRPGAPIPTVDVIE